MVNSVKTSGQKIAYSLCPYRWNNSGAVVCFIIVLLAFWTQKLLRKLYCVYIELRQSGKPYSLSPSDQLVSLIHRDHLIQTWESLWIKVSEAIFLNPASREVSSDFYKWEAISNLSITCQYLSDDEREVGREMAFPQSDACWVFPLQSEIMFFDFSEWTVIFLHETYCVEWFSINHCCRNPGCCHQPRGPEEEVKAVLVGKTTEAETQSTIFFLLISRWSQLYDMLSATFWHSVHRDSFFFICILLMF